MWYAITEFIWGSTETTPKTRAKTRVEEGWILVDTDKTPTSTSKIEIEDLKDKDEPVAVVSEKSASHSTFSKSPIKRKIIEHQSIFEEDEYNPKVNARGKYMRDARRKLDKKDLQVITVKDDGRRRKLPTSRKLKREELRQSYAASKDSRTKTKLCFQPRGKNH